MFGWFYGPFLLCNLLRPSFRASIETEQRRIILSKMLNDCTIQSSVDQSIRGHKENCLFIDSCFTPDSPKYFHINTVLKDRYLQFVASGYRPCKGNFGEPDKKFINFIFTTGRKEDEIKRTYEKFGSDEKVLKVKLEKLAELYKGQTIRF